MSTPSIDEKLDIIRFALNAGLLPLGDGGPKAGIKVIALVFGAVECWLLGSLDGPGNPGSLNLGFSCSLLLFVADSTEGSFMKLETDFFGLGEGEDGGEGDVVRPTLVFRDMYLGSGGHKL